MCVNWRQCETGGIRITVAWSVAEIRCGYCSAQVEALTSELSLGYGVHKSDINSSLRRGGCDAFMVVS